MTMQKLRNQLASEFGQSGNSQAKAPSNAGTNGQGRISRKDQVEDFIKAHGPSTRNEVIAGTGIPAGTASYALNDESRFVARDGKWHLRE